jgi:hypothetical protein
VVELWLVMGWGSVAMFLFVWGATQNLKSQQYISTVHGFRGLSVNYDFFILIPNILPNLQKKSDHLWLNANCLKRAICGCKMVAAPKPLSKYFMYLPTK